MNRKTDADKKSVVDDVKVKGKEMIVDAKATALNEADARKANVADYAQAVAAAINSGADELKGQGREKSAKYVSGAADSVSGFAERVSNRSAAELLGDVEDFARERPALFFGATVIAGFALARFLKSSNPADSGTDRDVRQVGAGGR